MTRILSLASAGGSVVLDGRSGMKAGLKVRGTGLPSVTAEWFEGAGDGKSYQGGRTLSRVLDLPVKVYGIDRLAVSDRLSALGRIFRVPNVVRLTANLDGIQWYVDVVRTGGGDWGWDNDTDGRTFVKTVLTVEAGDPFWAALDVQQRVIKPSTGGGGLLGPGISLVTLTLSEDNASGVVGFDNTGDVPAPVQWTIRAPFSGFTLTSPTGEVIDWGSAGDGVPGATKTTGYIVVDTDLGTVVDEAGVNQYGGLGPAPQFWLIPNGASTATISMSGTSGASQIEAVWRPRKLVMF